MNIQLFRDDVRIPEIATAGSAGYDIFMPEAGEVGDPMNPNMYGLGFGIQPPANCAALVLPRSGTGFKYQVELCNSVGLIDHDYTNEWFLKLTTKTGFNFSWKAGERVAQFIVVPVLTPPLSIVEKLEKTTREGGLGSTGK